MTQKIYVYIPGLEYISKGPLHIDAIHLKVTVNLVKNDSTDESNIPVYLFKGDDVSGDIKGNIVYKQITPYESITTGIVPKYPTSGPSATQAKYRAKKGRYYDFVKEENNTTKHLITPQPQKADGATCSNLNLYEHDGLFVVELDKLNTDLVLNFTFYSRIDNSESTEGVITFGTIDSEGDHNTIDFNKYVEVGKWVQTYNPAISGVKEEEFKRADFELQYFDLKGWGTADESWEIPVNADILVTRLGDTDLTTQHKKISGQYSFEIDPNSSNYRKHVYDSTLQCNQGYGSRLDYSSYYRNFYRRTDNNANTANDERILYLESDDIIAYNPDTLIGAGLPNEDCTEWKSRFFLAYGYKNYKPKEHTKDFYITYTNLNNLQYLYRQFPSVNINNVCNSATYADTDKNSRPIAAVRFDSFNFAESLDDIYQADSSTFKEGLAYVTSDLESAKIQRNRREKGYVMIPENFGGGKNWNYCEGTADINLLVELPNGHVDTTFVKKMPLAHYKITNKWPSSNLEQNVSKNMYIYNMSLLASSDRLSNSPIPNSVYYRVGSISDKNKKDYKKTFYLETLNSFGSGLNKTTSNYFWFNGGNSTITLSGGTKITQKKSIIPYIPTWEFVSHTYGDSFADIDLFSSEFRAAQSQINARRDPANIFKLDFGLNQQNRYAYIFIPEMWYIDLNKSNITYDNKADFKVCPMIYTNNTGYLIENNSPVVSNVNIIPDNLLDDSSIQKDFEILRVLNIDDASMKAPYDLDAYIYYDSNIKANKVMLYDTSYCTDTRFLQVKLGQSTYQFRLGTNENPIKLEPLSLYVLKAQTLFPFKIGGIGALINLCRNNLDTHVWYSSLTSDGLLLIYNKSAESINLILGDLTITPSAFNLAYDTSRYSNFTDYYNVLSGVGLYKVNLGDASTNTMVLKEAFDEYKDSRDPSKKIGIIPINGDSSDLFYNRIIFPAAHCAEEDVVFCDLVKRLANTYKPDYRNTYYDTATGSDPIVHTYNFKYLPDKAIYRVAGFYTLPTSGNEYKVPDKYTPFSDKYNFKDGNPVVGITVKQIQM